MEGGGVERGERDGGRVVGRAGGREGCTVYNVHVCMYTVLNSYEYFILVISENHYHFSPSTRYKCTLYIL